MLPTPGHDVTRHPQLPQRRAGEGSWALRASDHRTPSKIAPGEEGCQLSPSCAVADPLFDAVRREGSTSRTDFVGSGLGRARVAGRRCQLVLTALDAV